jgi:Protein of unknown function (DUF1329)
MHFLTKLTRSLQNKMIRYLNVITITVAILFAGSSLAAVSADEAKQLGNTLTPWGAEKAGNKDGSIPEWTGQVKIPSNYDPKKQGVRPDPFANEKPLFSINAQNMEKYADKLTDGIKAMMKKYPTFRIDVYPSHRTAAYPPYEIDNALKNATSCKDIGNGQKLEGCYAGIPFPIPKTGNEEMWNHIARYTTHSYRAIFTNWFVDSGGTAILQGKNESYQELPFHDPKLTKPADGKTLYWRFRSDTTEPSRRAGEKSIFLDPVDMIGVGRRVWSYIPGQRRVKLAPDLAYDTPAPQSGGAQNMDDIEIFLGAQDRFDFKLLGKKEIFIPYNNFKMADGASCPDKLKFIKNHMNPDCIRWELHRVYVVEATLKAGIRHVYKRRTFYFDEDAPGAGIGDNFDATGKIYRVSIGTYYPMYEAQGLMSDQTTTHDLQSGTYATSGEVAETGGWYLGPRKPETYYSGEALAADGIR